MAKNPTDWPSGGTPWNYKASVPPSGLDSFGSPTPNGEQFRKSTATPMTHSGKVGKSGGDGIGNPYAKQSDRSEMQPLALGNKKAAPGIAASGPEPKPTKPPVKWHKRGYNMTVPSTMGGGHMRKPARNIG